MEVELKMGKPKVKWIELRFGIERSSQLGNKKVPDISKTFKKWRADNAKK